MDEPRQIEISKIDVGQHAQRLDEDDPETLELSKSIKRIGLLCPLIVRKRGERFVLVAGHRRIMAARMAGLDALSCIYVEEEPAVVAEITFAENFFRKNLSPIELAAALKDCLDNKIMSVTELAAGFHKTEHWVERMIAISDWPDDVQQAVHNKLISVSAAGNLALVTEDAYREFLVKNAVEQGATARTTAAWLQAWRAYDPPEQAITAEPVPLGSPQVPLVPQAPCLCCSQLFGVNEMSHVPVCGPCIQILRIAGASAGAQTEPPTQEA